MNLLTIVLAVGVVVGMTAGQILFKITAGRGGVVDIVLSPGFWGAGLLYGLVSLLWVLLLRHMDLSRAYSIMAATFVLVPIVSFVFLGERISTSYVFGMVLIIVGIMLAVQS